MNITSFYTTLPLPKSPCMSSHYDYEDNIDGWIVFGIAMTSLVASFLTLIVRAKNSNRPIRINRSTQL